MTTLHTALLAAILGLAACQGAGASPELHEGAQTTSAGVSLTGIANGSATLRPGQALSIALPSNGSTGYVWRLAEFDAAVLARGSPFGEEATDPHPAGILGVGGETHWRFEAGSPGTTTLIFTYGRPWDKDAAPAETARYTITVR